MKKDYVEAAARQVHKDIWRDRTSLWPTGVPSPVDMLTPETAAKVLGVRFEYQAGLGRFGGKGDRYEVAGLLDRPARMIQVSEQFRPQVVRFTGAHEVGHWVLHDGHVMHRDRPIEGLSLGAAPQPPEEQEANYFAACFLMPPNLLMTAFTQRFGKALPFAFNDATAFHLCPAEPDSLLYADESSHDRAVVLASCRSFNGKHFLSLAEEFRVSVQTMAIRLEELKLLEH